MLMHKQSIMLETEDRCFHCGGQGFTYNFSGSQACIPCNGTGVECVRAMRPEEAINALLERVEALEKEVWRLNDIQR